MTDVVVRRSTSEPSESTPKRLVDHLDPRLVKALTVIGFGLPILGYFWVVANFSVNVIYGDQLSDVNVIRASYAHLIPWEALWAQYQTNRLFFPNLIVVLLAHTTHFNIRIEVLLDATMLLVATALVIWTHRRRSPSTPWLYYCPVALLTFSLVQYEDSLFGYQMAWYLVLLSLAVALALLDRTSLTRLTMIGAIAAAIVGSFSSFQGLLIWPTGLVLLYHRRRSWPFVVIWIVAGVASAVLYFRNLNFGYGLSGRNYVVHHLWPSGKFFLLAIGDVLGFGVRPGYGNGAVLLFGVVILLLAIASIVAFGIRRDDHGGGPVGVALICFGLLFAASITEGRSQQGLWAASQSRYTTYDLLILVGIYLTVLGSPTLLRNDRSPHTDGADESRAGTERWPSGASWAGRYADSALLVARVTVVVVITAQVLGGLPNARKGIRDDHSGFVIAARVARSIDQQPDANVRAALEPFLPPAYTRRQIRTAKRLHLSLFDRGYFAIGTTGSRGAPPYTRSELVEP